MTTNASTPAFRDLSANEADRFLARHHVGRIAYTLHDRVDIEPIHYVYADDVIYLRTGPGWKLETLAHSPWVAFEIDEVHGLFDWRSVVVHGTVYVVDDAGPPSARESYRVAVERLRHVSPNALSDHDPTPDRSVILKIHPSAMRGRAARSRPAP